MANRRSYKADTSFLEKISIGAVGTHKVFDDLCVQGHRAIELERGSMSFKIWKTIKIKRVRVPDILCVDCGRRVESRAKTKLEISMSHSVSTQERGWDFGLDDCDFVAFVQCARAGDRPTDWRAEPLVHYVSVRDMRAAFAGGRVIQTTPKGAEEGFEVRVAWPSGVATADGKVVEVAANRVKYRRSSDGRLLGTRLTRGEIELGALVNVGDCVRAGQVVASVVPVCFSFPCGKTKSEADYVDLLSSPSLSDRYTAAKALSRFQSAASAGELAEKLGEEREHIYVRLEAAASLMRLGDGRGIEFVEGMLSHEYLENRLEAVIILGEIKGDTSCRALLHTLQDGSQDPEIRAGAAWSLGEIGARVSAEALVDSFLAVEDGIRVEAARALAKIARKFAPDVTRMLASSEAAKRPGIAWALSKSGQLAVDDLVKGLVDEDARRWIAFVVGTQDERDCVSEIEELKLRDPEVYFAVTVLWKVMSSWVYGLEEY